MKTILSAIAAPLLAASLAIAEQPIVIAHRGASGYLPEHTLEAYSFAYALGADYIEQDVVLTKDSVPVVLHDIHLDTVTNVATVFPERHRDDGRFYAIDFTLQEIKRLNVHERCDPKTQQPVYANRFPANVASFEVPTLREAIELIQGLNKSTGRQVGIYPEIKKPRWHRDQGQDISPIVQSVLRDFGYDSKDAPVFLQCFDPTETQRLRFELNAKVRLVQLIGSNDWNEADTDYKKMLTDDGLKKIASYADGVGPWMEYLVRSSDPGKAQPYQTTDFVDLAHSHNLLVHPFTFRADSLPPYVEDFDTLLRIFRDELKVDGYFTDFPDRIAKPLKNP